MKKDVSIEKKLDQLIHGLDVIHPTIKQLMWRNFLRGIAFGLGTTVGVALIIGILTYFISQLKTIPFFETLINETRIEDVIPNKRFE